MGWANTTGRRAEKHLNFGFGASCIRGLTNFDMMRNNFDFVLNTQTNVNTVNSTMQYDTPM